MQSLVKIKKPVLLACLGLILISGAVFIYTVEIRKPWFGYYSGKNHDWLTASTLIFTKNWYEEGAWNLKFGQYELPKSPELPSVLDRYPYISYPPGAVIPIYMISEVTGQEPTIGMIMGYDLANHLAIAIVLALTVFFFLTTLKLGTGVAFSFSLIPIFLELLLPSPLYYQQNSFYTDEAVILPFVIVVFLEVIRGRFEGRPRRIIDIVQTVVFFYGVFTDWFFVFIAFVIYVKRLLSGEYDFRRKKAFLIDTLRFTAAPFAAVALFAVHSVLVMQGDVGLAVSYLKEKYLYRAGTHEGDSNSAGKYFQQIIDHIEKGYGSAGRIIIFASVYFVVAAGIYLFVQAYLKKNGAKKNKKKGNKALKKGGKRVLSNVTSPDAKEITLLAFVLLIPCVLQIFSFMNHSAVHDFSALKLSVPISIVPFVLIPLFFGVTMRDWISKFDLAKRMPVIVVASLFLAGTYLAITHGGYRDLFANKNDYWYQIIGFTNAHTKATDVVFSPEMEVPYHPPQLVSLTMKRVYMVRTVNEIFETLKKAKGDYRVVLMFRQKPQAGSYWYKAVATADSSVQDGAFYLYFSPESVKKLLS